MRGRKFSNPFRQGCDGQYPGIRPPDSLHYFSKESNEHYILDPIVVTPFPYRILPAGTLREAEMRQRVGGNRRIRGVESGRRAFTDIPLRTPIFPWGIGPSSREPLRLGVGYAPGSANAHFSVHETRCNGILAPSRRTSSQRSGTRACTRKPLRLTRPRKVVARDRDHRVPGNREALCILEAPHELRTRGGDR